MKFQIETKKLLNEITNINKVTNSKSSILLHTSVKLEVRNNELILTATDMDHQIQSSIKISEATDGIVIVKTKDFMEVLKKITEKNISLYLINNSKLEDSAYYIKYKYLKP